MILKKFNFPLNIFICFEKIEPVIYTSKVLNKNHYVCFLPNKWYVPVNIFIKNELFYNNLFLSEISAIDTIKYNKILPEIEEYNFNKRLILFNIYYNYFIKTRLTFIYSIDKKIESIDFIFNNASWLEREVSEMFGINYINKTDNRALLLDYSRNENPMLKDFPTEGLSEIYFDFFENKLNYVNNEFIEL